ncbi:hypothetical protein MPTK1_4g06870 [Marchantia polymorpha subsp. ruderalis]|uniref:Uncharacterized protein n=2 Tax=Marchantia polymorpha TaxID=3197 RepID=A0AAF6B780_MARPO|nr:hypothetical protein MARPO_0125s0032 [Marchantia polymorpha]BBN07864.1 hypothetical protein Mp_4g06870 [Marchantia polymorpha subsp. ruderalis]|eukprot:PTQ30398.1 hypothetical protein MARPO_0125s0032 [Marchantia polymorpha]
MERAVAIAAGSRVLLPTLAPAAASRRNVVGRNGKWAATSLRIRATAADSVGTEKSFQSLSKAIETKDADAVRTTLDELREAGIAKQWSTSSGISRRTTFIRELTTLGIKNAEELAIPSTRNDAAFLATVVGTTSVIAVVAGQLPGDWGFFVPYLVGGISLGVLAVGSVSPGLLQAGIDLFSGSFADSQERVLRHEAAHFLVAYLVGLPIVAYSLDLGKEHVNLVDEKLQKRIYEGQLDSRELDRLAVVSMAGLAAEGLKFDKVMGQSADLFSLQRLINRTKPPLSNNDQQNLTRWAVLYAGSLLKNNAKVYEALMEAMKRKAPVAECVEAIEKA